jgi:hypothetical protein
MCKSCLRSHLSNIEDFVSDAKEAYESMKARESEVPSIHYITIPLCILNTAYELRIIALTKLKRLDEVFPNKVQSLLAFENKIKTQLSDRLFGCLEEVDEVKESFADETYLILMNKLKNINEALKILDELEAR